ncbi:uncharacterized protein UBRO_07150 [Ustilago bromivora]|uniref:Diphthine--ammonia ligase n=1 Tax=Ustilago bromivora TaxID=307758 RepID=A0A1K0HL08_9BASI|nr:uncharacterized protein UBRO_07150 [Ustilago bromivora]SYW79067.1 uncharacterized protein UBRO2_02751 [Ustilago bromivora]
MKVVGLLSGGKDSCYNLLHCLQQGHQLVALATLSPPGSKDELDSYMYQTVGHDAVHLVAQAMKLPLYRRTIVGTALNQRSEYGSRTPSTSATTLEDETEDLYHLLHTVKSHHPDIEAVSVGAILSNYQRVRVEHVALRPDLNLTPLTYLWQRKQSELYAEMLQAGLVSILIKVAGIGLDEGDLGKTLGQMQGKLDKLNRIYGAHVCGEGGEYETLTIDSPLFEKKVDVGDVERVVHSDSGFGSVSYLRLVNARLVEKERGEGQRRKARTPPLLDVVGRRTLRAVQKASSTTKAEGISEQLGTLHLSKEMEVPTPSISRKSRYVVLSNITGLPNTTPPHPVSVEDQVRQAFTTISHLLSSISPTPLNLEHISHINLYLRSQTHFASVNSIYRTLFGVSPPTRACVALPNLPPGCDIMINLVAFDETCSSSPSVPFDRRALHVQGRSFWAPSNIGPYSQSLVQAEKIWVAGQIGLIPSDLTLPEDRVLQASLSLQHARRILKATMNDMAGRKVQSGWVEGGVCWLQNDEGMVEVGRRAWLAQNPALCGEGEGEEGEKGEEEEHWLGQTTPEDEEGSMPPMLFVTLPKGSLPRSAAIEWQITAHTGRVPPPVVNSQPKQTKGDESDDEEESIGNNVADVGISQTSAVLNSSTGAAFQVVHTVTSSSTAKSRFGVLTLRRLANASAQQSQKSIEILKASIESLVTSVYATQFFQPLSTPSNKALDVLKDLLPSGREANAVLKQSHRTPCSSLTSLASDTTAQPVDFALVWHGI